MHVSAWIALAGVCCAMVAQIVAIAYFMGRQSERIVALEREAKREAGLNDKVIRLEVQMEHLNTRLDSMDRTLQGVNRQLANIATKGFGPITEHA